MICCQIEALETNVRKHREAHTKNTEAFRQRLGMLNNEKSQLNATVADLRNQLKTLAAEKDALQSSTISAAADESNADTMKELTSRIEALVQEKSDLEKALTDERATKPQPASDPNPEFISTIVCDTFSVHFSLRLTFMVDCPTRRA